MTRLSVLIATACLIATAGAGCLSDVERAQLDTSWNAQATLLETPTALAHDRPAQLVVDGTVSISTNDGVQLTGIQATLEAPNQSIPLVPIRLSIQGETFDADTLNDQRLNLSEGDRVQASFLPQHGNQTQLPDTENGTWNASAELQYRYRVDNRFDAGRIPFEAPLTPEPGNGLGSGVPTRTGNQVTGLVFERIDKPAAGNQVTIEAYHVTQTGAEPLQNETLSFEPGEGVLLADFEEPVTVPEGDGYLLFRAHTQDEVGTVIQPDAPSEQPVPALGLPALLALSVLAALWARRRT